MSFLVVQGMVVGVVRWCTVLRCGTATVRPHRQRDNVEFTLQERISNQKRAWALVH